MTDKECAIVGGYKGQEYTIYPEQYCDVPWHGKDWQILIQYENSSYTSGPYETIEEAMANARADIDQHLLETEEPVLIPASLYFEWTYHKKRQMNVPKLVGIWIKHYGWVKGGKTKGDFEVKVELPFQKDIGLLIQGHVYEWYDLLPSA